MTKNDKKPFATIMATFGRIYREKMTPTLQRDYWSILKPYQFEDIKRAAFALIKTSPYPPKPSDIIQFIEGTGQDQSVGAWTKVYHAIISHGSWKTVVFDDPVIHAVIADMGGWRELCSMRDDEEPFKRQEFEKRYMAYTRRPPVTYPGQLIGNSDANNRREGYVDWVKEPVLIGDADHCAEVQKGGALAYDPATNHQPVQAVAGLVAGLLPEPKP